MLDGDDYSVDPDGDAGALVEVVLCRHLKKYRTISKKNNAISRPSRDIFVLFYEQSSRRDVSENICDTVAAPALSPIEALDPGPDVRITFSC